MTVLFWLFAALDAVAILLLFVLGLAAAGSAKTSGLAVAATLLVVPGLVLGATVLLFVRSHSTLWRSLALAIAAAPAVVAVGGRELAMRHISRYLDAEGRMAHFPEGPARRLCEAIERNDVAAVTAGLAEVDVNAAGFQGCTLLSIAMEQLAKTPTELGVLRVLLGAGANPNAGDELPLRNAIYLSAQAGLEPMRLLLAKGAKVDARTEFGDPVAFAANGRAVPPEAWTILLDAGAPIDATDRGGRTALIDAITINNWPAALVLLERGANPDIGRSVNALTARALVDSYRHIHGSEPGFAAVLAKLQR